MNQSIPCCDTRRTATIKEGGKFPLIQRIPLSSQPAAHGFLIKMVNSLYKEGNLPCGNSRFLRITVCAVLTLVSKNLPVPHHPKGSSSLWKPAATRGLIQTLCTSLKSAQDRPQGELKRTDNAIGRSRCDNVLPARHLLLVGAAQGFSFGAAALPRLFMCFHGPRPGPAQRHISLAAGTDTG